MAFSTSIQPVSDDAVAYPPLLSVGDFSVGTGGKVASGDPRLPALLAGASAGIRRYCGWHIAPVVDEDLILDFTGSDLIVLPTLRLVSVLALTVNGREYDVSTLEVSHNGEIRLPRRMAGCPRFGGISVKIRHGFDLATVGDVCQVVQQVVANAVASPLGATREQAGQVSVSWATTAPGVSGGISLLERDLATLDLYRLPRRA